MMRAVAKVLIAEPHADICDLLEIVVRRLGHEPVRWDGRRRELPDVSAAVVEPATRAGLRLATRLRAQGIPLVLASIMPPEPEALELQPAAYLVKPFALAELEQALLNALALAPVA
jgi:CheY-like chemotaxis protein